MPELGECTQLLVTSPFADDADLHARETPSGHHPLCLASASPERRSDASTIVTLVGSDNGAAPRLTHADGLPAEDAAEEPGESRLDGDGGSDVIVHPVAQNDSFASVALRHGVSIAAIRRANQLWPSDPIHLRTELLIPRGDALPRRRKLTHSVSTDTILRSKSAPHFSPNTVVSSFVAARNMILSALPARLSLESLSSKASASEDLELDDFQAIRALPDIDPPFPEEGIRLSVLSTPRTRHKRPALPLPQSQVPYKPTDHRHLVLDGRIPSIRDLHSRSLSSSRTVSLERFPRMQPFATLPVRTLQLEPEPAMELPVRRRAFI